MKFIVNENTDSTIRVGDIITRETWNGIYKVVKVDGDFFWLHKQEKPYYIHSSGWIIKRGARKWNIV